MDMYFAFVVFLGLMPLVLVISFALYLITWLRDKTRQDETMIELLATVRQALTDINASLARRGNSAGDVPEREE